MNTSVDRPVASERPNATSGAQPPGRAQKSAGGMSAASETEITLGVLDAVQENEKVTQRSVANELGVALGLVNTYLKRCVRKGLIKVKQIPPNRYLYYLTPKGFSEKSRLTAEYLSDSLTFFRRARTQCDALLARCLDAGWRRVALAGRSELAEIAALCNADHRLDLVVVDPSAAPGERLAGLDVLPDLDAAGPLDAAIITDMTTTQETADRLGGFFHADRILAPAVLRLKLNSAAADDTPPES